MTPQPAYEKLASVDTPSEAMAFIEESDPRSYNEGTWVLDTWATTHMTRYRSSLSSLDESVRGAMRFGDRCKMEIHGIDAMTIASKDQDHKVLTEVYTSHL